MARFPDDILNEAQDCHAAGQLGRAIDLYRMSLLLRPDDATGHYFLGLALFQTGSAQDAATAIRQAISIDPNVPEYHCDLGGILFALDDLPGAILAATAAVAQRSDFPEALFILGNACCKSGRFDEGIDAYQQLVALRGEARDALNNLGMALLQVGRIGEAIASFDRILTMYPDDPAVHSNRIYAMYFSPLFTATDIRGELARWNRLHAQALKSEIVPHQNAPSGDRLVRVGYVSADFREHVVGWNMLSWLGEHDATRFHVTAYSNVAVPDAITGQLQSHVHSWRDISRMSDADAAKLIREDQIDILVDLSLHTSGNRLPLFARKPAPIQVTWLAYPGSSGLEAMDYRLSDPFLETEQSLADHTERTICLPKSYWCYRPGGPTPGVVAPPVISNGYITFGCLNQFQKVSSDALDAWQRIMSAVPDSRLLLHTPAGGCRAGVINRFAESGIEADRLEFVARLPWTQYVELYQRIDIALDPFPYCGGITSCDALWMGIPLITLCGRMAVERSGASILQNLGLSPYIARSPADYVLIATPLAGDHATLSHLRSSMRRRMLESPLMNGSAFARSIESAFWEMWSQWEGSAGIR